MLKKIIGGFHFSLSILGTEILSVTLFTDEDQALGYWSDEDGDEDDDEDGDEDDDDPDPTDSMLDALNEIVRWEGHGL